MSLYSLGTVQSALGKWADALASTQEAVDALWPFFVAIPAAFARDTRMMLSGLLVCLKVLGRPPGAATVERVARYQEIAGEALDQSAEAGTG